MTENVKTMWVVCAACGHHSRKHGVLYQRIVELYTEEDQPPEFNQYHRLVQCMGCETIKYVISKSYWAVSDDTPPWDNPETDITVYPDAPGPNHQRSAAITQDEATDDGKLLIPSSVWKMYKETIDALNANIRTLAGGGLRATVEAICLDKNIRVGNLQNKIDELVKQNLLTQAQADLLHEERYIGNAALHELETPSAQDIEDGLGIVEGLINTIYILPAKATRLKKRREFKQAGGLKSKLTKS